MNNQEFISNSILEEKYRPHNIDNLILPSRYESIIRGIKDSGKIPHMLLYGPPGCGKTSLAYILANETNASLLYINASLDRTTDIMKNQVLRFCTKNTLGGKKYKIILLDEIDNSYAKDFRKNLLSPIEKYGENTRFILTVNNKMVLDPALISRCSEIDFVYNSDETKPAKKRFIASLFSMLDKENIKYDSKAIAMLVEKKFPDMRKVINTLNLLSKSGDITIDRIEGILYKDIDTFFAILKSKDFNNLKDYTQYLNISTSDFYKLVYDNIEGHVVIDDIPKSLIKTYEYMRDSNLVLDPFISLNSFGLDLMLNVRFK